MLGRMREARVNVKLEAAPIAFSFTDWKAPIDARTGRRPTRSVDVTRATFDNLHGEHRNVWECDVRQSKALLAIHRAKRSPVLIGMSAYGALRCRETM